MAFSAGVEVLNIWTRNARLRRSAAARGDGGWQ
jgi:hypothetical protein